MTVNMDKSNILVFKNGGNLSKNEKWYFKDELIKVVSYYKYLGVFFSSRLKWTMCCKTLRIQSEKAINMIKHCMTKLGSRDINFGFRLFNSTGQIIFQTHLNVHFTLNLKMVFLSMIIYKSCHII
jgi:hypothetical protein